MKNANIRVLVVDDSLFMRTLVSDMLRTDPGIEVADTAKDGEEALRKTAQLRPNCITLDLAMPGWNGFTTLGRIMSQCPTPVVLLSAHSREGARVTMQCLGAGAVGFVLKPSGELSLDVSSVRDELLGKVKAAASANLPQRESAFAGPAADKPPKTQHERQTISRSHGIIVVGASTGGPQTLGRILPALPPQRHVPLLLVQHMPSPFFTTMLAEHLGNACGREVVVAVDGQVLQDGGIYLAPAGFQTRLVGGKTVTRLSLTESKANGTSPSIDLTMKSAAEVFGDEALGIILSGVGSDGRDGMKAIKQAGGLTIAEDHSALIFGMPKAVIEAGLADKVVPSEAMAETITELLA